MSIPNLETYSVDELKESLKSIDKNKYPERHQRLLQLYENKISIENSNTEKTEFNISHRVWQTIDWLATIYIALFSILYAYQTLNNSFMHMFSSQAYVIHQVVAYLTIGFGVAATILSFTKRNISVLLKSIWFFPQLITIVTIGYNWHKTAIVDQVYHYYPALGLSFFVEFGVGRSSLETTFLRFNILALVFLFMTFIASYKANTIKYN